LNPKLDEEDTPEPPPEKKEEEKEGPQVFDLDFEEESKGLGRKKVKTY